MVPQLAQGFLQPRTRGRTGKPQRVHIGRSAGRRGSGAARDQVENAGVMPSPVAGNDCPAASPPHCPAVLPNPIRPGQEWIGEPFHPDSGIEPVATVHHGRIGQGEKLSLDRGHERCGVAARQVRPAH